MKMTCRFTPGDPVIYRVTKHSPCPGPRAKGVSPSRSGEDYSYQVDKFWVVDQVLEGGQLLIRTRRGKTRVIDANDYNLRAPRWWESLLYRRQFPTLDAESQKSASDDTRHRDNVNSGT